MKAAVLLSVIVLVLCACATGPKSQVRIDGTSEESTAASLKALQARLGNRDTCLLHAAILRIQIGDRAQQEEATGDESATATPLGPKINGMAYDEIIALAQQYPNKVRTVCRH